jgi:hypothetical protein
VQGFFSLFIRMDNDQIKNLAEAIAKGIAADSGTDLKAVQKSIDKLDQRLGKLEAAWIDTPQQHFQHLPHPSQDRFAVAEAIVDGLFAQETKEKTCTFEPDRSCDHCSMCSSRGF